MNRRLTALFAALEALLVVGVGIGIPLVPLTIMWAVQYGLQIDWIVFLRAAIDAWLLGHGTDLTFRLDDAVAASAGLPGVADPFPITIAPLAFALVTVLLGVRAGRRIGETYHRHLGRFVAIAVFAILAAGATLLAVDPNAQPSLWQGVILPPLVFALGIMIGSEASRPRAPIAEDDAPRERVTVGGDILNRLRRFGPVGGPHPIGPVTRQIGRVLRVALSGGAAAAAMVMAVSAVTVAVLIAVNYGRIIGLYEAVQSGVLGGAAVTVAQLALLPNLAIWTASWFVGPGFAIGTGSTVGPLGTVLGPIPAIPVLGALPEGDLAWGYVGLLVPVLAGFAAGVALGPRLARAGLTSPRWLLAVGAGVGIFGGSLLGALAWASAGAAGPGRLVDVGPSWWPVALWAALEIGLPAILALFVARSRSKPTSAGAAGTAHLDAQGSAQHEHGDRAVGVRTS